MGPEDSRDGGAWDVAMEAGTEQGPLLLETPVMGTTAEHEGALISAKWKEGESEREFGEKIENVGRMIIIMMMK